MKIKKIDEFFYHFNKKEDDKKYTDLNIGGTKSGAHNTVLPDPSLETRIKKFRDEAPDSVKFDEPRIDVDLIHEIEDRLLGPKGKEYKEALKDLNKQFPKILAKYGHDIS